VDDSGHIAWWIVGGVVGGVVGFGTYAITHQDNFEWRQAALWTVGGVVVGATFGAGAQWVAGALGTEAAVTAGTAATTAGAAASSPAGQRTILWLEEQLPRVEHIMAPKHAWDRLINLSGNALQDYRAIQPYIQQAINVGTMNQIGVNKQGQAIVELVATINGQQILVQAVQIAANVFKIGDAWVITR
jgi:hypothetical protein